jgi:large subunit ribosomal protein L25
VEIIKLTARPRTGSGKSYTRKARASGWVPAIYYGRKLDPVHLEVNHKEFATIVRTRKTTHLIDLGLGKANDESIAVIREVQRHVIKNDVFFHIDFHHIAINEKVIVEVPLILAGLAIGVKDYSGILGSPVKTVKVECMPLDIPENVTIDVSALNVGDSIHARDVVLTNLTLKEAPEEVLAVVVHPTREIASAAAATTDVEGAATAAPKGAPAGKGTAPAKAAAPAAKGAAPAAKGAAPAKAAPAKKK